MKNMFSDFFKNLFSGDNMDERLQRLRKDIREEFVQQQTVFEKSVRQRIAVYAGAFALVLSFAGWQAWNRMQDDTQKINTRLDKIESYMASEAGRTINVINNIDNVPGADELTDSTLTDVPAELPNFSADIKPDEDRKP